MAALWPSVRSMGDISGFMDQYPDAIKDLFDVESITTGSGYLNAELFSIVLPAMFIVFATGRGARLIAGEEEGERLATLLTAGVPRRAALAQSATTVATSTAALAAVTWAAIVVCSMAFRMGVSPWSAATGALSMLVLGVLHGSVALAVGAATGRRTPAVAASGSLAGAGYVLYVAGQLVRWLHGWQPLSPFTLALRGGPVGAGLPLGYGALVAGALVALVAAAPAFDRRDVRG
jgi:ABC-2 type transport system permease protein